MNRLEEIVADVVMQTEVTRAEIFGPRRTRRISRARWAVWARLAELGWTSTQIALPWGADHSSVLHGLKMVGVRLRREKWQRGPINIRRSVHDEGEAARAETIRRYWAERGVEVNTRIENIRAYRGRMIGAVRSTGIPVRAE